MLAKKESPGGHQGTHNTEVSLVRTDRTKVGKILLLEDDESLIELIEVIKDENRWPIDFAVSSGEALSLLADGPYDAIIMDWNLPDFNGDAFIKLADSFYKAHCEKSGFEIYDKVPIVTFSSESKSEACIQKSQYFVQVAHWKKPMTYKEIERGIADFMKAVPRR